MPHIVEEKQDDSSSTITKDGQFDIVYIPIMDATTGNTDIQTITTNIYDKQFDLEKLKESWYKLVDVWPFLASRVRECKEAPSELAYHIPKQSQLKIENDGKVPENKRQFYGLDLSQRSIKSYWHGGAERLFGENASIPFLCDGPNKKDEQLATGMNNVRTFKELLNSDRTTFTTQATLFSDATMITLSFAHIIGDGFCVKDIFHAWSNVIRGELPQPQPIRIPDNFLSIGMNTKPEKLPLRFRLLGFSDKLKLVKNLLYDYVIRRPERTLKLKYIHLPDDYVSKLHKEANEYLIEQSPEKVAPFRISRSDIALAFLVQMYASNLSTKTVLTPVTIANARGKKVTGVEFDFSHVLGGAAILLPLKGIPVKEIKSMSIGQLASLIHQDIGEQVDPNNLRNSFQFALYNYAWKRVNGSDKAKAKSQSDGKMAFFGEPDCRFVGLTDWRALQLQKINFQGACLNPKENDQPCLMKAVNARMITPFSHRDRFACIGDLNGSLWLSGTLSKKEWNNKSGFGQFQQFSQQSSKSKKV